MNFQKTSCSVFFISRFNDRCLGPPARSFKLLRLNHLPLDRMVYTVLYVTVNAIISLLRDWGRSTAIYYLKIFDIKLSSTKGASFSDLHSSGIFRCIVQ